MITFVSAPHYIIGPQPFDGLLRYALVNLVCSWCNNFQSVDGRIIRLGAVGYKLSTDDMHKI